MQLSAVLKKVGATVVKEKVADREATLYLRVDPEQGAKWVDAVTTFLLGCETKPFKADVSKYFYAERGAVKYLWRMVVTGEVQEALQFFGAAAMESQIRHAPEITSMPLVGRKVYPFDPARGMLKGSHDIEEAAGLVSMAVGGGVP